MLVRNIETDVRQALPNSVRVTTTGTVLALKCWRLLYGEISRCRFYGQSQKELDFTVKYGFLDLR